MPSRTRSTRCSTVRPPPRPRRSTSWNAPCANARRKASGRGVEIVGLGGPWQNLAVVRRLEATNGYNPLRIGFYDRLVAPGEGSWRIELRDFPGTFDNYECALARALGLEFVVLGSPIEKVPHLARRPVAEVLKAGPVVWVYRLRDPTPRLTFLRRVQVADTDAVNAHGQLLTSPSPDRVLIDDDTPPAANYAGTLSAGAGSARIASWRGDRVEIEVDSEAGGMLALHDTWYPGWVAEIDGERAPILRADVLFRGLEVPAGRHRVVFHFAPFSLENLVRRAEGCVAPAGLIQEPGAGRDQSARPRPLYRLCSMPTCYRGALNFSCGGLEPDGPGRVRHLPYKVPRRADGAWGCQVPSTIASRRRSFYPWRSRPAIRSSPSDCGRGRSCILPRPRCPTIRRPTSTAPSISTTTTRCAAPEAGASDRLSPGAPRPGRRRGPRAATACGRRA